MAPLRNYFGDAAELKLGPSGKTLEIELNDEEITVAPALHPVPKEVTRNALENAWYWPDAESRFGGHRSHMAVVIKDVSESSARLKSMLLTRLTSVIGEALGYVGVYWEPAEAVHSSEAFSESSRAMSEKELPLRIWVRFNLVENPDGTHSLYTTGLDPLGFLELEVRASKRPPENIQGWAFNIAHFLLDRGVLIPDGDTVGVSQSEWIRVHHLPSAIDPERRCLYLDLDLDEEIEESFERGENPFEPPG